MLPHGKWSTDVKRWKVRLGPDRMPIGIIDRQVAIWGFEKGRDQRGRYAAPTQYAPGYVYVSAIDEMGAYLEAMKWTESHPL